ncbi:MAG: hypothetical protein HZA77_14660 [Candidatus Schekmanbacteria bacterium]|nr:hypothetical protein [Candidatus Schekmanbacteria bacterium]
MMMKSKKAMSIVEGGSYLIASRIFSVVTGVVLVVAFTNLADKELFGSFRYFITILGVLSPFSLPEINTAIIRTVAAGKGKAYINGTRTRLKAGVVTALIAAVTGGVFYKLRWNADIGIALIFASPFLPLYFALDSAFSYLNGRSLFRSLAFFRAAFALVTFSFAFAGIYFFSANIEVVCVFYVASASVFYFFCTLYVRRLSRSYVQGEDDGGVVRLGTHLSVRSAIASVEEKLDTLFIGSFFSMTQLAVFSVGRLFNDQMGEFSRIIQTLLLPGFSREKEARRTSTVKLIIVATSLFAVMALIIIIVIPWIVPLLFTSAYSESIRYAKFFCILQVIGVSGGIIEAEFVSQERIKELYLVKIAVPIAYFAVFLILVPYFGMDGIIYALFIRMISFSGLSLYLRSARAHAE